MHSSPSILLIVSGGIAASKAPDLVRRLSARGVPVRVVLTDNGARFVSPLVLQSYSGMPVYRDLFSLNDEHEMGHIRLSRESDLILIAPASADLLARMAGGQADDLASTALLAADKPVMVAPAMNVRMWDHPATQANVRLLQERGVHFIGPEEGDMACGEYGLGRMSEPADITEAALAVLGGLTAGSLQGRRALVSSGPTIEDVDPVRYLANRSSGRQGHAIATALRDLGADVTLITGPVSLPVLGGVQTIPVRSARDMLAAFEQELKQTAPPVDIAVFAAAVCDWRVKQVKTAKIKKEDKSPPTLRLVENPDILKTVANHRHRPQLVVGFAAETDDVIEAAAEKRRCKGCDWILANDVSPVRGVFEGACNTVHVIDEHGMEHWPTMTKEEVARRLSARIAAHFKLAQEQEKP